MIDTIFNLIKDPSDLANWMNFIEALIALAAFVIGIVIIACYPAFIVAGAVMVLLGVAGLVFGHF